MYSAVYLSTVPQPLPKPVLHTLRSSASSFNFQYPLIHLRSPSSCLRLFPRLSVTSILPSTFPSITCFRRQSLSQLWPIQLSLLLFTVCTISLSTLTLCNTSSFLTRSVQLIFSSLLQYHISKLSWCFWSTFQSVPVSVPHNAKLEMAVVHLNPPVLLVMTCKNTKTEWADQLHHHNAPAHSTAVVQASLAKHRITQVFQRPLQPRFGSLRLPAFPKAKLAVERVEICECDGHTVHQLSQRCLTADWLAPRDSDCSRKHSKVSSNWLQSYIKATRPVIWYDTWYIY